MPLANSEGHLDFPRRPPNDGCRGTAISVADGGMWLQPIGVIEVFDRILAEEPSGTFRFGQVSIALERVGEGTLRLVVEQGVFAGGEGVSIRRFEYLPNGVVVTSAVIRPPVEGAAERELPRPSPREGADVLNCLRFLLGCG